MPGSDSIYYYVRCKTDGIDRYMWLVGYENSIGLVSPVGGELPGEMAKELESEFQKTKEVRQSKLKTINEKVL